MLRSLELDEVMNFLFAVKRSGSWKNQYLSALNEVYQEGQFLGCKIYKPNFPTIGKVHNKADIFTEAELERLFKQCNFSPDLFFLFFLCSLSGGLRLGEARAMKAKQIVFDKKAVIVDGFLKDDGRRTIYNKRGSPEHPKLRVIPYPDFTLTLLRRYIEESAILPEDYVFSYQGKPVSKSLAEHTFTRALISAGIARDIKSLKEKGYWKNGHVQVKRDLIPDGRRLIPHSLRYTYITRMSRDMDAHNLIKLTGHESTEMIDYYNRKNLDMALAGIPDASAATSTLLPRAITGAV
jgi:integrase